MIELIITKSTTSFTILLKGTCTGCRRCLRTDWLRSSSYQFLASDLRVTHQGLHSLGKLTNWTLNGGDPFGENWKDISVPLFRVIIRCGSQGVLAFKKLHHNQASQGTVLQTRNWSGFTHCSDTLLRLLLQLIFINVWLAI
ncbi:hypothetical protein L1987_37997 [Smallanthus sonchifolius]|uniref:Uncharacterized protein n=1 Tax=Smallanthus sonchifolius TaxID=185202 RepID=A0ACB9HHZ5_9ASTR|nr:hypothetical protein L1987_37997 [Smallanthus sonchifolius]